MTPIRLAVVDDSSFIRTGIKRLLEDDSRIQVVGTAATGEELLDEFDRWRPDVITLDLNMPGMGGIETLDRIQEISATPVIVLSTHSAQGAPLTLDALSRGAVDFIDKEAYSLVDFQALRSVLLEKILSMAQGSELGDSTDSAIHAPPPPEPTVAHRAKKYELIVVGASTGGPSAVERVLTDLGPEIPVPVIIAQHMPAMFTGAFAERLDSRLPVTVREAVDGDRVVGGTVYVAPGDQHISLSAYAEGLFASVATPNANAEYSPSVDALFESAANIYGDKIVGVLLSGMGDDGAKGMSRLASVGAHTIAQDRESCVVYGMPRVAVALNAVREIQPLDKIGERIRHIVSNRAD